MSSAITKTGKKSDWKALLGDAGRSLGRLYQNTFLDGDKQEGLDMLLVSLLITPLICPASLTVSEQGLHRHLHSVTSRTSHLPDHQGSVEDVGIWISTYNVEGRSPTSEIKQWLDFDGGEAVRCAH